jgi:Rap1a immunity proteins
MRAAARRLGALARPNCLTYTAATLLEPEMKTILAAALIALPCTAFAATEGGFVTRTAGDLADVCSGGPGGTERTAAMNFCLGYAQGLMSITIDKDKAAICLPANPPSRAATMKDFATWARASEQHRSMPAARGLLAFFQERFPCKN